MGAGVAEAMLETDCIHNDLTIEVFPDTQAIAGSNTMTLASKVEALTEFTFVLRSNYAISSVVVDGVTTIPGENVVSIGTFGRRITLPRAYAMDEQFTVRVNYSGVTESAGLGGIFFVQMRGLPFVGTLSEPYFAATWWPCKDSDYGLPGDNSDKATLDIAITAPDTLTSVCNGLLQGIDTLPGNRKRTRWHSDYPIATYLVSFASYPYRVYDSVYNYPGGSMPFTIYISPTSDTPLKRDAWARSLDMMAAFRPLLGEYPFIDEKYAIYEFPGNMEHQTCTGMYNFLDHITAHELGHHWFGDNVTCRTWGDIWLSEGGASYCEALWEERRPGGSLAAYREHMTFDLAAPVGNSTVYCYDTTNTNLIFTNAVYKKGAWVFHMLRGVAGDEGFANILTAYRNQYQASGATTNDFAAVCTGVLGTDMQYFFDQWVYAPGAVSYAYGKQQVIINGQRYLCLSLRQTQPTNYGVNGVFKMPIDILLERSLGTSTSYRVLNNARIQHFVLPFSEAYDRVTLDKFSWILTGQKTEVPYENGPSKIVQATPAPGDTTPVDSTVTRVTIAFSEDVLAQSSHFTLEGPHGPVAFGFGYTAFTATLNTGPLPPGEYRVTVSEDIRTAAANFQLDGEILDALAPLPSGDGQPGGDAHYSFTVLGCPADFNHDTQADFFDYLDFVAAFDAEAPEADFNHDATIDFFDYLDFVQAFDDGCE
jgi:aminopeptidase N